jgi:hypothetical protein
MGGSAIFVSIFVIHVRKRAFEKRFGALVKSQREQVRKRRSSLRLTHSRSVSGINGPDTGVTAETSVQLRDLHSLTSHGGEIQAHPPHIELSGSAAKTAPVPPMTPPRGGIRPGALISPQDSGDHITFVSDTSFRHDNMSRKRRGSLISFTGVGASPLKQSFHRPGQAVLSHNRTTSEYSLGTTTGTRLSLHQRNPIAREILGRNSQFHGLTLEEREQLGGVEYRAITLLSWVVPVYFVLWQFLASLGLGAWMAHYANDITQANAINPWFVSITVYIKIFTD